MIVYGLSTLALNDGGGVSAQGDVGYLLRVIAGVFGVLFLGAFFLNFAFTLKGDREEEELRRTVKDLRSRARAHESDIRNAIRVSVDEASNRFFQLGLGSLETVLRYFQRSVPPDFFHVDEESDHLRE